MDLARALEYLSDNAYAAQRHSATAAARPPMPPPIISTYTAGTFLLSSENCRKPARQFPQCALSNTT